MLRIQYGTTVVSGQQLTEQETQQRPLVFFKGTTGKQYTLIMSDPDAPAHDWLHWLIVNNDGTSKKELVPYNGPAPPSGKHRYQFFLCEQKGPLQIRSPSRANFATQDFIKSNGLRVVAKVQYTVVA
jgi:phosphatidylethanolamine-binding protein (PEBP) family uncharacterized protein